ncbi:MULTISPECIES: response regulator transcription factor [Cupriavidus]|uniref:response regulator transcription factor n=1 Tax=Cupriavidus TaxID=106589 RepID=UPI0002915BE5|nr:MULTISPECIES: response regulator [Cupriavidus]MCD9119571.1 response regulator [Cupriavidus sp. UGS-1]
MVFAPDSVVAVIDDDPTIVESISDLLASVGHATLCFATATALLECPYLDAIACLISDIRMPVINGWQLAAILQQRRPGLQVVLMTAHDPAECGTHALPPDSVRILRKPFEAQQLLSAVEHAIGSRR